MQVSEQTQVRVTLSQAEYEAIMARLKDSDMHSVSELLKQAVLDFCRGGYTPLQSAESELKRATSQFS